MFHAIALAFLAPGLLFMALGTSLALRKTPVGAVIGLRSVKAFANPVGAQIAADVVGFDLTVAGAVVSTTAIANAFAGLGVAFNVSVLVSSLVVTIAHVSWTTMRTA